VTKTRRKTVLVLDIFYTVKMETRDALRRQVRVLNVDGGMLVKGDAIHDFGSMRHGYHN
jgi:hypothetical protein